MIFKSIDKKDYKALCERIDAPLTQQYFYGEWQELNGKKVWRYAIENGGKIIGFFQVIKNGLPYGKSYLYIPRGPVLFNKATEELENKFSEFAGELTLRENAIFLRAEGMKLNSKAPKLLYDANFQPKYEWEIDLSQSEEDILAGMKKVNRYTVRQAEKLGVTTEIIDINFAKYLDKFYELIESTAERDNFSHNTKEYYKKIFDKCEEEGNAFMEISRFSGEIMLINFFVIYGKTVFFLFSGSENEHRKVGYTYLAQWEAIKYAKRLGLKKYNFGAVVPEDNKYPFYSGWQGFSDFKKRFGGSLIEYHDSYDFVRDKFWYLLFALRKIMALIKRKFSK